MKIATVEEILLDVREYDLLNEAKNLIDMIKDHTSDENINYAARQADNAICSVLNYCKKVV